MTEDQLEQETLAWLQSVGYVHIHGGEVAPGGPHPERNRLQEVLLQERLRAAIERLNQIGRAHV